MEIALIYLYRRLVQDWIQFEAFKDSELTISLSTRHLANSIEMGLPLKLVHTDYISMELV